jgi:hypothetical protein
MAVTPATLRVTFPEFSNTEKYPDAMVQMWLDLAVNFVNVGRWAEMADHGVALYAAHHLILAQRAGGMSTRNGVAGGGRVGIQTSKSIDGVSVSHDVSSVTQDRAGHFNMTVYGLQFVNMARLLGAGPVHIGADLGVAGVGGAWPGVVRPPY